MATRQYITKKIALEVTRELQEKLKKWIQTDWADLDRVNDYVAFLRQKIRSWTRSLGVCWTSFASKFEYSERSNV